MSPPTAVPDLFTPLKVGRLTLKNRIIFAPLTRNRANPDLTPGPSAALYYSQRATGGLLITEATQVSVDAQGYPLTPGIYTPEQVQGWKVVVQAVKSKGAPFYCQIWHCGRSGHSSFMPDGLPPFSASAVKPAGEAMTMSGPVPHETPREMSKEEIQRVIGDFRQAALNSIEAGFDGIELHGANGYLIDQFLRDSTNKRTDEYGGSVENRFRFLREMLEAVCDAIGSDRVGVRLSPGGTFGDMSDSNTLEHFTYFVKELNKFQLAYLSLKESDAQDLRHGGEIIPATTWRPFFDGPIFANTGYTKETGEKVLATGKVDAVVYGRLFLANPDLPARFQLAEPKFNEMDPSSFFGGTDKGYIDYPFLEEASQLA